MLSEVHLAEIREHLEKAQNPLFFFDNDVDGLCSFLLLRRFLGRGRGVAIKSFPDLHHHYIKKVHELKPDMVFILDKALVSKEFLNEIHMLQLPLVWIDHHEVPPPEKRDLLFYYNPVFSGSSEPTTYLCYKVLGQSEDVWLAVVGCISDGYLPEFYDKFTEKYPEYADPIGSAFQCLYDTKIGEISRILSFALKDRTSQVVNMLRYLFTVKYPSDILVESKGNTLILGRFRKINEKYRNLLQKARGCADKEKILYFQYAGDLSISADLSNELIYRFPEKIIVVAYMKESKANVSVRGNCDVREITLKVIKDIEGATGGGHKYAIGAQVPLDDLPRFRENMEKIIKEKAG